MVEYVELHLQNTCACLDEDGAPSDDCFGDCWDEQVDLFRDLTAHLFTDHKQRFRIVGFPTWRGPVNGMCQVEDGEKLLRAMTPSRTEWRMEVGIYDDRIEADLFHHDAPTGGVMVVTPINEVDA